MWQMMFSIYSLVYINKPKQMALIMMVNAIFLLHQNGNAKIFQLENVKESVLKLRRFDFDKIFSIKLIIMRNNP